MYSPYAQIASVLLTVLVVASSQAVGVIDPDVASQLSTGGRTRVLVELRVDDTGEARQREDAIARTQDAVLSRLSPSHSQVVRRYTSIPMLALEIDATALQTLQTMAEVLSVKPDRTVRPQ